MTEALKIYFDISNKYLYKMKKVVSLIILSLVTLSLFAQGVPKSRLISIVDRYRTYEEVDVMKIGSLGTMALKNLILTSMASEGAGAEALLVMDMIRGVKKMAVMDYGDCSERLKNKISSDIESALRNTEVLMEAKDEGSTVRMYGLVSEDSNRVSDFVLFTPDDCSLVCLFGSISMEAVMKLADSQ